MSAPIPSQLDHQQCIQGSFDETTGRLRVDASLSASIIAPPGLEVSISSVDDSIRVVGTEDGTQSGTQHVLRVSSNGSLVISNFPTTVDTNYGTIGASSLRIASQIGNATGAANFNAGATGAQTLRTASNLYDGSANALTSTSFNSKQSLDVRPNEGFSTGSNTTPTITNSSSTVLAANTNRKYAYVFNQTGVVVYLKLGSTAVIGEGIRLVNNSMFEILSSNLWTGTINAIKSGATGVALDIFEGTT